MFISKRKHDEIVAELAEEKRELASKLWKLEHTKRGTRGKVDVLVKYQMYDEVVEETKTLDYDKKFKGTMLLGGYPVEGLEDTKTILKMLAHYFDGIVGGTLYKKKKLVSIAIVKVGEPYNLEEYEEVEERNRFSDFFAAGDAYVNFSFMDEKMKTR